MTCSVTYLFIFYYSDYARAIKKLPIVKAGHGVHVQALIDIEANGTEPARKQLKGPLTYIPSPEVVRYLLIITT